MTKLLKKNLIFVFVVALFGLQINDISAQTRGEIALKRKAETESGDKFTISTKSPKGAKVYAVTRPSRAVLNAIDKGLGDLITVARKNGYRSYLNYSDYSIFIARADRQTDADGKYSPGFAIPVRNYAGSDYDKGGFMYAAGMVIGYSPAGFMIVERTKDFDQISDVVRFEGEHIVLYHNDRRRYNETADHSKGGGHPILQ